MPKPPGVQGEKTQCKGKPPKQWGGKQYAKINFWGADGKNITKMHLLGRDGNETLCKNKFPGARERKRYTKILPRDRGRKKHFAKITSGGAKASTIQK